MGIWRMVFRSADDVNDYKDAGKKAKHGLSMVMKGLENGDKDMAWEGMEEAYKGVRTMCDISQEMEDQYGERNTDDRRAMSRDWHEWNARDDELMERRMRDSRGRFR